MIYAPGDTYATSRMKAAMRTTNAPRLSAGPTWAAMNWGHRADLYAKAIGCTAGTAMDKVQRVAWEDLTPRERMLIGAKAREQARALL